MVMNKILSVVTVVFSSVLSGCASELMTVRVVDPEGMPVPNMTVSVRTMNKFIPLGSDRERDYTTYCAVTDTNGMAKVSFRCVNAGFSWSVRSSNGFYCSDLHREEFKFIDMGIAPPILNEHEKTAEVVVWPKRNPQPMYARHQYPSIRVPRSNGRFGFDMKNFDWLPPQGKGEVADFYLVQNVGQIKPGTEYHGFIEFDEGCGAYVARGTGNKIFPSTYSADTNRTFVSHYDFLEVERNGDHPLVRRKYIAQKDEYMVLRTRVKRDAEGNVVAANYSKFRGPVGVGDKLEFGEMVFNPRVNDVNLELDSRNNLVEEYRSHGLAP